MVRVISVHHFTSQDVASVDTSGGGGGGKRPLASTIAGDRGLLLVSLEDSAAVQVRDLTKCARLSHTLQVGPL